MSESTRANSLMQRANQSAPSTAASES